MNLRAFTLLAVVAAAAPGCKKDDGPSEGVRDPDRTPGATEFVSADGYGGQASPQAGNDDRAFDGSAPAEADAGDTTGPGGGGDRAVEEGDIYRVLDGGLIANLNAFRGLQLIDFSNVQEPSIIGRMQISGEPVELYVVGTRVFLLMNNWRGYWGSRFDEAIVTRDGGVAVAVDISDPAHPTVVDQAYIPGYISRSRVVRNEVTGALYVAAGGWAEWENGTWDSRTVVKSFDISAGTLQPRTELNLGGYVTDIQATPQALLVARHDWNEGRGGSRVTVVDISDPSGLMVEGDEVEVAGYVASQFNMDLDEDNGVLRVVSGSTWDATQTNHLQTFDASDFGNITVIDHDEFGAGQQLFATLFVGDKAFFVTYLRVDPFHAFSINAQGVAQEMAEFVVSGWNDFFRAVLGETRLVGIGTNDAEGRAMSVSLYDITDLTNPQPLLARADVEADHSWSEASWDHRAFSVLDGAVAATTADGVLETGLVLLPFSGWNEADGSYAAAVQIFTFSGTTLTRRGIMEHGTPVRRSFLADEGLTANLSEAELSLFTTTNPDKPVEEGRLELAPNYTDLMVFGDYVARVKNSSDYYYGWWGGAAELPPIVVEIVPLADDPDTSEALASIEVPANAALYQTGNLLVSHTLDPLDASSSDSKWQTTLTVYDLSNPLQPTLAGTLTTDRLQPSYGSGWGMIADCFDCGRPGHFPGAVSAEVYPVPGGLVFLERTHENEMIGRQTYCYTSPAVHSDCDDMPGVPPATPGQSDDPAPDDSGSGSDSGGSTDTDTDTDTDTSAPVEQEMDACTYYQGGIQCTSLNGSEPACSGEIYACNTSAGGDWQCVPIDAGIPTQEDCHSSDAYRYWQQFTLEVVDLSQPTSPRLNEPVELARGDEGVSVLAAGSDVWVTYVRPVRVVDDPRPYVRYFVRQLDLADVSRPSLGSAINVPGELVAVDGSQILTRDIVWGTDIVETAIARLLLRDGLAELQSYKRFENQVVSSLALDGDGRVLVSHRAAWEGGGGLRVPGSVSVDSAAGSEVGVATSDSRSGPAAAEMQQLTILRQTDLVELSQVAVDTWATLRDARNGRALFEVPGGLLVFNVEDATSPYPQAYFATRGWPSDILVHDSQVFFAAGRYGVYAFDLGVFNLLTPASN